MRSPLMLGTGIGMVIVGPVALLTAVGVLASAHKQTPCFSGPTFPRCTMLPPDRGEVAAGSVVLSLGAIAALGGIVMIVIGGTRIPFDVSPLEQKPAVWLTPDGIAGTF